jgi:eukaryotic-like serine/threonine-protein kinase
MTDPPHQTDRIVPPLRRHRARYNYAPMALASGTKLGPYEIIAPLGAGGMGEVYRATQTTLGRQVAIKLLSPEFAANPDRLRRFELEARSASALNHPNIISIYDVGSEGGNSYIAMEFVDGKTLRALLEAGPLGIKKSLQIAAQIADGLAKAHAANIVHRDLKPENVMVTRDGFVKILDFGLAKLMPSLDGSSRDGSSQTSSQQTSSQQTMTSPLLKTHPGMVMGTAGYMSPEQARGEDVDYRSDIFSFGAILYEMVAGKQAFHRPSSAQTLAAIIEDDPQPVAEANPKIPTPLRWIIERSLAKDPEERYASTRDLARDLHSVRDHLSTTTSAQMAQAAPAARRSKWILPALCALAGAIIAAILTAVLLPRSTADSVTLHQLTFSGADAFPSVSPDGRTVAFVSRRDGTARIWLKQLQTGSETALTPGPNDSTPRFSPDNAWILYTHEHAAYRIPSLGGEPRKLLDNSDDANWCPDGSQLVYVRLTNEGAKLQSQVGIASVADGTSRIVHSFENRFLAAPAWSPDGSTIALNEVRTGTVGNPIRTLVLMSSDGRDVRELECPIRGGALSSVTWSGDGRSILYQVPESPADVGSIVTSGVGSMQHILLQDVKTGKGRTLFTMQLPSARLEIAGPGRLIFDTLALRSNLKEIPLDPAHGEASRWLTRGSGVDRQPYYSPDGNSVAYSSAHSGDADIWDVSLKTNALRRLTDHPALDWDPFVTADGQHLIWSSNRSGNFEIWMADRDGSAPRQVSHDGVDAENPAASPDGWIVYASSQSAHPGLWKMRFDGSEPSLLVPGNVAWPDISHDGQYVLYHTTYTGSNELYDISVIRLSNGAHAQFEARGTRAKFATDGHSILYVDKGGSIARMDFPSPQNAPEKTVVPADPDMTIETFHISPDGRHLVVAYQEATRSLVVADGVPDVTPPSKAK